MNQGDIIYIHGHTGKYLEPAVGKANLNIFAMLREGLRNEFHTAFRTVVTKKETVSLHNIKIRYKWQLLKSVNIDLKWIDKPESLYGNVMIIFTDVKEVSEVQSAEIQGTGKLYTISGKRSWRTSCSVCGK